MIRRLLLLIATLGCLTAPAMGQQMPVIKDGTLTAEQTRAIVARVRQCWTADPTAPIGQHVWLDVTADPQGIVRRANIAASEMARVAASTSLRAFSERAVLAVMNCHDLPLPRSMLGQLTRLTFDFRP